MINVDRVKKKWAGVAVIVMLVLMCVAWGDNRKSRTVRTAAVLTTAYVASAAIPIGNNNQVILLCAFTKGSSDGVKFKVEFSEDNSTWYQETDQSLSSSLVTHTVIERTEVATNNFQVSIPLLSAFYRVSSKAITTGTGTSLGIIGVAGKI